MRQKIIAAIMSFALCSFSAPASAYCGNPFGNHTHYYLVENLNGKNQTTEIRLAEDSSVSADYAGFFALDCEGEECPINFYIRETHNKKTLAFEVYREERPDAKSLIAITRTCDDYVAFLLGEMPRSINVNGQIVDTDFQAYSGHGNQSVIGVVKASDAPDDFALISLKNETLSRAKKMWLQDAHARPMVAWEVENKAGVDPSIIAYLVALKERSSLVFVKSEKSHGLSGLEIATAILAACATVSFLAVAAVGLLVRAKKQNIEDGEVRIPLVELATK